jgi:hypothetical protein
VGVARGAPKVPAAGVRREATGAAGVPRVPTVVPHPEGEVLGRRPALAARQPITQQPMGQRRMARQALAPRPIMVGPITEHTIPPLR